VAIGIYTMELLATGFMNYTCIRIIIGNYV